MSSGLTTALPAGQDLPPCRTRRAGCSRVAGEIKTIKPSMEVRAVLQSKSFSRVSLVMVSLVLGGLLVAPARSAEENAIHDSMEAMNKSYKKLKTQVTDKAQNEASLKLLLEMQKNVLTAKGEIPERVKKASEADRAKLVQGYRTEMNGLMTHLIKIETAVSDGNNAEAEKLVAALMDIKKAGHDKFTEE